VESTTEDGVPGLKDFSPIERTVRMDIDARQGKNVLEEPDQLPQYAVRINEYAQRQNVRIAWDETTLSLDPPRFRVATRIEGRNFEGMAANKKTARHLAAKEACIALHL